MQLTTTPRKITDDIRRFCRSIRQGSQPQYVDISPAEGSIPLECFENVRTQTVRSGGRIQFGWTIWEWPGVYLEAEHHAVYDPGDGRGFVDLTPAIDRETRRLFFADDEATYNFDNPGIRVDNRRFALRRDPIIEEFFALAAQKTELMNTVPGTGIVSLTGEKAREYAALERGMAELIIVMFTKYAGRNSPCICGSGRKFKHCHGERQ